MPDVDIPGVGSVSFPETMSHDEISSAAGRLYRQARTRSVPFKEDILTAQRPQGMTPEQKATRKAELRNRLIDISVQQNVDRAQSAVARNLALAAPELAPFTAIGSMIFTQKGPLAAAGIGATRGTFGFAEHYAGKAASIVGLDKIANATSDFERNLQVLSENANNSSAAIIADQVGELAGQAVLFKAIGGGGKAASVTDELTAKAAEIAARPAVSVSIAATKGLATASALKALDVLGTKDKKERQAILDAAPWDVLTQTALSGLGGLEGQFKARSAASEAIGVPEAEVGPVLEAKDATGAPLDRKVRAVHDYVMASHSLEMARNVQDAADLRLALTRVPDAPIPGNPAYDTPEKIAHVRDAINRAIANHDHLSTMAQAEYEKSRAYLEHVAQKTAAGEPVTMKPDLRARVREAGKTQAEADEMAEKMAKRARGKNRQQMDEDAAGGKYTATSTAAAVAAPEKEAPKTTARPTTRPQKPEDKDPKNMTIAERSREVRTKMGEKIREAVKKDPCLS